MKLYLRNHHFWLNFLKNQVCFLAKFQLYFLASFPKYFLDSIKLISFRRLSLVSFSNLLMPDCQYYLWFIRNAYKQQFLRPAKILYFCFARLKSWLRPCNSRLLTISRIFLYQKHVCKNDSSHENPPKICGIVEK